MMPSFHSDDSLLGGILGDIEVVRWNDELGRLELLDQTRLPADVVMLNCETVQSAWEAIVRLSVRGAPAIGIAAAYAVCLAVDRSKVNSSLAEAVQPIREAIAYLATSRPTAVNLFWALDRMAAVVDRTTVAANLLPSLIAEAKAIHALDRELCDAMGRFGAERLVAASRFLTHCNAGALATGGIGTALAPIYHLHRQGRNVSVYADETRPLLQGSRLTAWELSRAGIPVTIITDSMAATVMREGRIDAVIVGADRITARGDVANKIGTYPLAVIAKHHGVPFFVAAPSSTFDLTMVAGTSIPIEQRSSAEITAAAGWKPNDAPVTFNPAFDVTPAELVTAIITDRGVIESPNEDRVRELLS
jgi:methylthioribose-1-phosphate isomerase